MKTIATTILIFLSLAGFSQQLEPVLQSIDSSQVFISQWGDSIYIDTINCNTVIATKYGGIKGNQGNVYFVSNDGNDSSDGKTPGTAWETISKVNGFTFAANDVVLLKGGDEWREQLTIPTSNLNIGAYGNISNRPILNGSDLITSWENVLTNTSDSLGNTVVDNSFFETDLSGVSTIGGDSNPTLTHETSSPITGSGSARLSVPGVSTNTYRPAISLNASFTSTKTYEIAFKYSVNSGTVVASGLYNGGIYGINETLTGSGEWKDTVTFSTDYTKLIIYFDGTNAFDVTLDDMTAKEVFTIGGNPTNVWQSLVTLDPKLVILDGTLGVEALELDSVDVQDEWFWNSADNMLYLYSVDSPLVNYTKIEVGARNHAIYADGDSSVNIRNIEVKGTRLDGMRFYGSGDGVKITNCYANNTRQLGFAFWGYSNCLIVHSRAEYTAAGFYVYPGSDGIVFRNDTSMHNIHYSNGVNTNGQTNDGHGFGIQESNNCIVENCVTFENNGGIVVDNNYIDNYTVTLRYNKLLGSQGQEGVLTNNYGVGIARIGAGSTVLMHHNLIYDYGRHWNSSLFVQVEEAADIKIYNNTFVNPSTVDGDVLRWYRTATASIDFRNNIVVGYTSSATAYQLHDVTTNDFTYSDYNLFYSPNMGQPFKMGATTYADLSAWQTSTSLDANSVEGNPLFTNEFTDFSLQTGSPAINAGTGVGLTQDINGNQIVGVPDIGAYESDVTP